MIILVEGSKNVGKSYLIGRSKFPSYKFPFIPYYKQMIAESPGDTGEGSAETFHFTAGFDVALLSMQKNESVLTEHDPLLVDRSFLSNLVLGELQSRITHEYALKYIDFLAGEGYLEGLSMVYVDKHSPEHGRSTNKDDWEFLGYEEQKNKYEQYFRHLKENHGWMPSRFINHMQPGDVGRFDVAVLRAVLSNELNTGTFSETIDQEFLKDKFMNNDGK